MRRSLLLFPLLLPILLSLACAPRRPSDLRVGVLIGMPASMSEAIRSALETALDLRQGRTIGDSPVRLIVEETQADPQRASRAFRRLIEEERVPVVIAATTSDETLFIAPEANHSRTVLIATASGAEEVRQAGSFVYRVVGSAAGQVKALRQRMEGELKAGRVAAVTSKQAFSASASEVFLDGWADRRSGPPVVFHYSPGTADFGPIVQQLGPVRPVGVFFSGVSEEAVAFARQLRQAGLGAKIYFTGRCSPESFALGKDAAEGIVVVQPGWDPHSRRPEAQAFVDAFQRRTGALPDYAAASTFDALALVLEALKAGAGTSEEIRQRFAALRGFPGVQGDLTFDADGEVNLGARLMVVHDGKLGDL